MATLEEIFRSNACMVLGCNNGASPDAPFCRECYAAMPKRSRRRFWRGWKQVPPVYAGSDFWYLVAHRLGRQNRQLQAAVERYQEAKFHEIEQLYSMGVTLSRVSQLAIENKRLKDLLDENGVCA